MAISDIITICLRIRNLPYIKIEFGGARGTNNATILHFLTLVNRVISIGYKMSLTFKTSRPTSRPKKRTFLYTKIR